MCRRKCPTGGREKTRQHKLEHNDPIGTKSTTSRLHINQPVRAPCTSTTRNSRSQPARPPSNGQSGNSHNHNHPWNSQKRVENQRTSTGAWLGETAMHALPEVTVQWSAVWPPAKAATFTVCGTATQCASTALDACKLHTIVKSLGAICTATTHTIKQGSRYSFPTCVWRNLCCRDGGLHFSRVLLLKGSWIRNCDSTNTREQRGARNRYSGALQQRSSKQRLLTAFLYDGFLGEQPRGSHTSTKFTRHHAHDERQWQLTRPQH
jgi:hypothetical protein